MTKHWVILKDGAILVIVASIFATLCDSGFNTLKKHNTSDPLVTAILQSNIKEVNEILDSEKEKGILNEHINRKDEHGQTPLMWIAYIHYSDSQKLDETDKIRAPMVSQFLKLGAHINDQDNDGWTPLMWSCWSHADEVTNILLDAGADLDQVDHQGNSALMLAAQKGCPKIVEMLLSKGARSDLTNKQGLSALDFAIEGSRQFAKKHKEYQSIVKILNNNGPLRSLSSLKAHFGNL